MGISDLKYFVYIARFFRLLPTIKGEKLVRNFRCRAQLGTVRFLHSDVIHKMRTLGINMQEWMNKTTESNNYARSICTACNSIMGDLLEIDKNEIHCCIKVLSKNSENNKQFVETWVRSEPKDEREDTEDCIFYVHKNSVWSAFFGVYDGKYKWEPFNVFSCNNLIEYQEEYMNSRKKWYKYYKSTLVFPLRYIQDTREGRKYNTIGFLAFDSPLINIFYSMPDIFKYKGQRTKDKISKNI